MTARRAMLVALVACVAALLARTTSWRSLPGTPTSPPVAPAFGDSPAPPHALSTAQARAIGRLAPPIAALPSPNGPALFALRDRLASAFFAPGSLALSLATPPGRKGRARRGWGLRWRPVDARPVSPEPETELPARVHHLVGEAAKWRTDLPTYAQVRYRSILPGIDMIVEPRPGGLKYTLLADPGADTAALRFRYEGADGVRTVEDGAAVEISTGLGTLREDRLDAWQETPSGRRPVVARYVGLGRDAYSIALGPYDAALPLVIDPVISWSTYLGGAVDATIGDAEAGHDIALDALGNVYVCGETDSPDFPATVGSFQAAYGGPTSDAFVVKIDMSGAAPTIAWATYLGGTNADRAFGIAVDGSNAVYVCGETSSTDFPFWLGFQPANLGVQDAFVAKLNAAGSALAWSTYHGGGANDSARDIIVDPAGNAFIVGTTSSDNLPVPNGFDTALGALTVSDAFVAKVNGTVSPVTLAWGSYFGGPSPETGDAIALAGTDIVHIAGRTDSAGLATVGDTTLDGLSDAFVARVDGTTATITLSWATYVGGSSIEFGHGLAVDSGGNSYVVGETLSANFPVSATPADGTFAGTSEAFVARVNPAGTALDWATFLGGNSNEVAYAVALDASMNVYVAGVTYSADFPLQNAFDPDINAPVTAFVTKIDAAGATLAWSTYLGGGNDAAYGIAVDGSDNAYVTGVTESASFPKLLAFDTMRGGAQDAFVTRINAAGTLGWSSYLGGTFGPGADWGTRVAVDSAGHAYVTGYTMATDFPTFGAFDAGRSGPVDAFVSKANVSGLTLLWTSYLGGSGEDYGLDIAVDSTGSAVVVGETDSIDFPSTNGFQANQPAWDGFVTKIRPAGNSIAWSTYLGGSGIDRASGVALGTLGAVYVTGDTNSTNFPLGAGGFDAALNDGVSTVGTDAFVARIDGGSTPAVLAWASYLGGTGSDQGSGIAVDGTGNLYVAGTTWTADFPAAAGFDLAFGAPSDAFIAKINAVPAIAWASFLGGSGDETGFGVAVDAAGAAHVTGLTLSADFPAPAGLDPTFNGVMDAFVSKVDPSGTSLAWSTYLGGASFDAGRAIAVDPFGDVLVAGTTFSADFPTLDPFDAVLGGLQDAFASKILADGSALAWSSYLGGTGEEQGMGIAADPIGNLYVTGDTNSTNFPTTPGSDTLLGGDRDAFITRIRGPITPQDMTRHRAGHCGALGLELLLPLLLLRLLRRKGGPR